MTIKKDLKNNYILETIDLLYNTYRSKKRDVYTRVAELLNISKRREISLNLFKLQNLNNVVDGSIVVIPGKILGTGNLNKKITIYAYSFSKAAKNKYNNIKTISDFCKDDIDYKKVVIIK